MKKLTVGILAGICLLFLAACGNQLKQPSLEQDLDAATQKVINSAQGTGQGTALIRMNYVARFDWDQMYIFGPDTTPDEINKQLGFEWKEAEDIDLEMEDGYNLLVFVEENRVVRYVKHPRNRGDFEPLETPRTPGTAVFIAEEQGYGEWLIKPVNSGGS